MGVFPYPIQYFYCKKWQQTEKDMAEMLRYFAHVGVLAAGPVACETGIPGLKIDFNNGIRLQVPQGNWHVIIGDHDSQMVFYEQDVSETIIASVEKYYIHWQVEVYRDGQPVFAHVFQPEGQKIRLFFNCGLLGDMQSFLPYVPHIRDWWQADVYYTIGEKMWDICSRLFPDIRRSETYEEDTYATFYFNASIDYPGGAPIDGRIIPMTQTGQVILGLPEPAPKLPWIPGPRVIEEPYVCIGVQGSSVAKGWLYPGGWDEVVDYLKQLGYRVLCIDKDKRLQQGDYLLEMPEGAEDFTGDRPLLERADMLHYADFFIGLSSGLSWLARTADCPVIMIAGFTDYWYEFPTPYRVYNRLICSGCYNDRRYFWQDDTCPRQEKGTDAVYQCSKKITPLMVKEAIDRLIADRKAGRLYTERCAF